VIIEVVMPSTHAVVLMMMFLSRTDDSSGVMQCVQHVSSFSVGIRFNNLVVFLQISVLPDTEESAGFVTFHVIVMKVRKEEILVFPLNLLDFLFQAVML